MKAPSRDTRGDNPSRQMIRQAQVSAESRDPVSEIKRALGDGPFSLVCLFVSPMADFNDLTRAAKSQYPSAEVMACTTAGELGKEGYESGQIIAIGFPRETFCVQTVQIEDLQTLDEPALIDELIQRRMRLTRDAAEMASEFAFLMVDGLSQQEEHLTGVLSLGLGPMPLFGGSAGDGMDFQSTFLSHNGQILHNGAILALLRSCCEVEVFSLDHFVPTSTRMVVTKADPERRIVQQINAEPAAREYARLLGKDPNQLTPFVFAAYPVVVRLGQSHHVRAIQRVTDTGELVFFSAVDEGMVLTLADKEVMSQHLESGFADLTRGPQHPEMILGCDCMLRRLEAEETQQTFDVSQTLRRHNVVGFSTYGEQIGGLHVNQTFTGVALYPPKSRSDDVSD